MNAHQLDADGVIINTIVVDSLDVFPRLVDADIGGRIGDSIVNGAVVLKPAAAPDIAAAIAATYRDVDAVYVDAIGQRGPEYLDAEVDARAFVAANYVGTPTDYVRGFAAHNPTRQIQTNRWAADNIIARADAFLGAKLSMRNTRFAHQAEMRAASTAADLATAVAAWNGYITALRAQLGV